MTVNTLGTDSNLGGDPLAAPQRSWREHRWPLLAICLALFSISALVYYNLNRGQLTPSGLLPKLIAGIYDFFGFAPSLVFFFLVVFWGAIWMATGVLERPLARLGRLLMVAGLLGVALHIGDGGVVPGVHKGVLGHWFAERLVGAIGPIATLVLVWPATFAAVLLATDYFFAEHFERLRHVDATSPEVGVEPAVTDHLRRLAEVSETHAPSPSLRSLPVASAAPSLRPAQLEQRPRSSSQMTAPTVEGDVVGEQGVVDRGLGRGDRDEPEPLAVDLDDEAAFESRRDRYAERRAAREARRAAAVSAADEAPEEGLGDEPGLDDDLGGGLSDVEVVALMQPIEPAPSVELPRAFAQPAGADELMDQSSDRDWGDGFDGVLDDRVEHRGDDATDDGTDDATDEVGEGAVEAAPHVPSGIREGVDGAALEGDSAMPGSAADAGIEGEDADEDVVEDAFVSTGDVPGPVEQDLEQERDLDADSGLDGEAPAVAIPRPDVPVQVSLPTPPVARQQQLFGSSGEDLVQEAYDVVTGARRATAALLQRKLRVDYELACELLRELAARGVVAIDDDPSRARLLER